MPQAVHPSSLAAAAAPPAADRDRVRRLPVPQALAVICALSLLTWAGVGALVAWLVG